MRGSTPIPGYGDEEVLERVSPNFEDENFDAVRFALTHLLQEVESGNAASFTLPNGQPMSTKERYDRVLQIYERVLWLKTNRLLQILLENYSSLGMN